MGRTGKELKAGYDRIVSSQDHHRIHRSLWFPEAKPYSVPESTIKLTSAVAPDGVLWCASCSVCVARRTALYRPPTVIHSENVLQRYTSAASRDAAERYAEYLAHDGCSEMTSVDQFPGPITDALRAATRRADSYLKRGGAASPVLVLTRKEGDPFVLALDGVVDSAKVGSRWRGGYHVSAAIREMERQGMESFLSALTYMESYLSPTQPFATATPGLAGLSEGATTRDGRIEAAVIQVSTVQEACSVFLPVVRRTGMADTGPGELGEPSVWTEMQDRILGPVLVEEVPI